MIAFALAAASSLAGPPRSGLAGPLFIGLGDLPGGDFQSLAIGVSDDGSAVVGISKSASGFEAFRWTAAEGMVGLGDLPGGGFSSSATGVSADGSVVVGVAESASGREAFLWTPAAGMAGLGDLPGGSFLSRASDISPDGSVVVGASSSTASGSSWVEAFRWTPSGGMIGLGELAGGRYFSEASGVSADGSAVVGLSESASGFEAFRWTSLEGMIGLGDLPGGDPNHGYVPGFGSSAVDASADGSVIVGSSESALGGTEAFRWTASGGMVGLGTPWSSAAEVSADGSVIVGTTGEGFRWTAADGMRSVREIVLELGLDLSGWDAVGDANAVSADGNTIVGWGWRSDGYLEGWILVIPEPPSSALALASLTVLLLASTRSRLRRADQRPLGPRRTPEVPS